MRASIDWPNWPTTIKSSFIPRRNGPKISCHGAGSGSPVSRNVRGTSSQAASPHPADEPLRIFKDTADIRLEDLADRRFLGGVFILIMMCCRDETGAQQYCQKAC